ncbi:hypothetical protein [Sphingomonas faeni]|uniref:hypothetical protein n=1 Tax=Sphingomonas faeni TaxID=185950 RepID=UPI003350C665
MSHKTNRQIFAVPTLLGIATTLGLGAGLIGDGGWDGAAGLLLATPLIVTGWYWWRPPVSKARRETRSRPMTRSA